jgi:hypothetical protein
MGCTRRSFTGNPPYSIPPYSPLGRRDDLERLVQFYERVTGVAAVRYTPEFAELIMPSFTLAIGHTQTTHLFGEDSARPADNHSVIIEFKVDDVDSEYERLKPIVSEWVQHRWTRLRDVSGPWLAGQLRMVLGAVVAVAE